MIKHTEEEKESEQTHEEEEQKQEEQEEQKEQKEQDLEQGLSPKEIFQDETSWLCCTTFKDQARFKTILQYLDLSSVQKEIIKTRYLDILRNLQKRVRNHSIIFFIGHFIITVGSLFVPALLSIQHSDREYTLVNGAFNIQIYWTTFIISVLVTIWNGILTLFRIDKKYYFLNTILESLRSEGWQYMSLTGRYSGHLIRNKKPTHRNQFIHFTHYIEKIKMKQIEEEYYRTDDKAQAPNTTQSSSRPSVTTTPTNQVVYPMGMIDLYSQSLDKPIATMTQNTMPDSVRNAFDSLTQPHIQPFSSYSSPPIVKEVQMTQASLPIVKEVQMTQASLPIVKEVQMTQSSPPIVKEVHASLPIVKETHIAAPIVKEAHIAAPTVASTVKQVTEQVTVIPVTAVTVPAKSHPFHMIRKPYQITEIKLQKSTDSNI